MTQSAIRKVSPADLFTAGNGVCGGAAIVLLIAFWGDITYGSALIIMAMVFDGLDGMVARRFGSRHGAGPLLDSVADSISFCAAPAVLLWSAFFPAAGYVNGLVPLASLIYFPAGVSRLVRFVRAAHALPRFSGLPVPAAATAVVVASHLFSAQPPVTLGIAVILAGLMTSTIPYPKVRGAPLLLIGGGVVAAGVGLGMARLTGGSYLAGAATALEGLAFALVGVYIVFGPIMCRLRSRARAASQSPAAGPPMSPRRSRRVSRP